MGGRARAVEDRAAAAIRRLAALIRSRAPLESRRRRLGWAVVAAALVLGPALFNVARESRFTASVPLVAMRVGPFPAMRDPGYYRTLMGDPELRKQLNTGAGVDQYGATRVRLLPSGLLVLEVAAASPVRAQELLKALAPQIAEATRRQLGREAASRAATLRAELVDGRVDRSKRGRLRQELRSVRRVAAHPPDRTVPGGAASRPGLHRLGDRIADALPGGLPARQSPLKAAFGGLLIAGTLWSIALLVAPPARTPAAVAAAERRARGRLHAALGRVPAVTLPSGGPAAILAVAGVGFVAAIMYFGRDLQIFRFDEWGFVLGRHGSSVDDFLRPHNEHLSLVPVAIFKGLLATVGVVP